MGRWKISLLAALLAMGAMRPASAGGSLDLPVLDPNGQPIDVGILVLGHSTSATGDWPGKLGAVLNADPGDGRNYVVFRAITNGDGGFLWSQLAFAPGETQYDRVLASAPGQSCQDAAGTRWSCRRLRLERGLTGSEPAPPECAPPANTCTPPAIAPCVWHENGQRLTEAASTFKACWDRMDVKIALVQDTTNRSWAVDDNTGDGLVDSRDFFLASDVPPAAWPCGGGSGVINPSIDWSCDGLVDGRDAAADVYAGWLAKLAGDLLGAFGASGVQHVFFTQKPIEMQMPCGYFPGEPCSFHGLRSPTPSRPFDHDYLPTVYWEYRGLEALMSRPDLDPRIHWATPKDHRRMWNRSVQCYDVGIGAGAWTIPATSGRPSTIAADDTETDGVNDGTVGCLLADHVHHTTAGGWLMADVWYEGLRPYLQTVTAAPSEVADVTVTGFDTVTGRVSVQYPPACRAVDHAAHSGPLDAVGSYAFDATSCGLGASGTATFDPGPGSRFWILTGRDGYVEGSTGKNSLGAERPAPPIGGPCWLPRKIGGSCP